jgi:hypothetical protein
MENKFVGIMEQRTDSELMEILTKDRDEYQPEALKAAEAELEKRKLTVDQIESAKQKVKTKEQSIKDKANMPLGIGWKLLTFFIPGILNFLIARTLKTEGYDRKWKEAWHWTFYGFGFYIGLFLLSLLLIRL